MLRQVRTCDICGLEMPNRGSVYKLQRKWFVLNEERISVEDMCIECYREFKRFVEKRRSDNNAE